MEVWGQGECISVCIVLLELNLHGDHDMIQLGTSTLCERQSILEATPANIDR